jgi:SET domain-containing protein
MSRTSSSRRPFRVGRSKTGLGLFATKLIRRGSFIVRYTGRKLHNRIADELDTKYLFEINNRWTIDGSSRKNIARYINHSCRPNAEADVKKHKILISAIKTIHPGDEITYNYGRNYFNAFIKERGCKCAACHQKKLVLRSQRKSNNRRKGRKSRRRKH